MSWRLMPQLSVSCGIIQLKKCSAAANMISTRLGCYYAILGWGWCWGWVEPDIEAKVDLRLKLSWGWHRDWGWGWDEVGLKFSWSWVEVEEKWAFIGLVELLWKTFLKSTHIAEQHLFSMFHSIFAFDFDSISGGPMRYFLDWGKFQNLGSSFKDDNVLFSVPPSIITFVFDLI